MKRTYDKKDISYKTIKTLLASIYGFVGMKLSPFYEPLCMKTICSVGRRACDVAQDTL